VLSSSLLPSFLRRYDTANDIPPSYYTQNKVLRGRVVRVIDGDTIRIRHTPFIYSLFTSDGKRKGIDGCSQKKTSECTISVRLYGVDAPETPKFGNPGQPYSLEAKDFVSDQVLNKIVRVKLLSKDQYSRVVGSVMSTTTTTPRTKFLPFLTKKDDGDLSLKLMERGYATLYTGGGAQYNGRREELIQKMERAKKYRLGVWSIRKDDGTGGEYVDPAAYKRAMKAKMNGKMK
jgi:endonuclease YncB( thermonuclease family)